MHGSKTQLHQPRSNFNTFLTGSIAVILILTVLIPTVPVQAQENPVKTDVNYIFGKEITFQARIQLNQPVKSIEIFISPQGETSTKQDTMDLLSDNEASYTYPIDQNSLRAFSKVEFHYRIKLQDGQIIDTPSEYFNYIDNRQEWFSLQEGPFQANWYEGDVQLGQRVLDVAQSGLQRVESLLSVPPLNETVNIYIYPSTKEMQSVLKDGQNWVAGHADPDLGVMVVALPAGPEQRLLTEQRVPHELMHVMLYHKLGPNYANLPTWLSEGLASTAELYPNPDYQLLINNAYQKDNLLPFSTLCNGFPRDASNALLAYAQSASFTRYLHGEFGSNGIDALVTAYANGLTCERGVEVVTGLSLTQLERQWREQTFSENTQLTAINNLMPWIVLLVVVLGAPLSLALLSLRHQPAAVL
ncbi:MAG: peptidase MA family metallohydrolase [Anaerolineales bacterium]|jgi:hypothetical protein